MDRDKWTLRDVRRLAARGRIDRANWSTIMCWGQEIAHTVYFDLPHQYHYHRLYLCMEAAEVQAIIDRWSAYLSFFGGIQEKREIERLVDYLITKYGADRELEPPRAANSQTELANRPNQPKNTTELGQPGAANTQHGGSGSSAEMDHSAQTPTAGGQTDSSVGGMADQSHDDDRPANGDGQAATASWSPGDCDRASGQIDGGSDGAKTQTATPERQCTDATEASRSRIDGCEDASPDGEPTDRGGTTVQAPRHPEGDTSEESPTVAMTHEADAKAEDTAITIAGQEGGDLNSSPIFFDDTTIDDSGTDDSSTDDITTDDSSTDDSATVIIDNDAIETPTDHYGGVYAHSDTQRAKRLSRDARRVMHLLRQLIRQLDDADVYGDTASPRYDGARLVRELVTRRYHLARARRQELVRRTIVLLPDVSRSCSTVCQDTLAACEALALIDRRVTILVHSNGWLEHVSDTTITDVIDVRQISVAIALGDWDAGDHYRYICEAGAKLVWLDSYCARHGVRPASTNLRAQAATWRKQPVRGIRASTTSWLCASRYSLSCAIVLAVDYRRGAMIMTVREHVLQTFGADMLQLIDSLQPTDVRECALYLLYRSEFIILAASTYAYARGRIDRVGGESMEDYCDRHACAFLRHAFHDCSQRQVYEPPESVGHLMEAVRARYEGTHYTRALSVLAMAMLAGLDQPDDEAEQLRGYLRDVHALIMVGVRLDLRAAGILRD